MVEIALPLIGGLILLVIGGELLVRGAVQVATRFGVSPLVIGLTLVGFGTSTPELVTSVQAALSGSPGIAYGNIVGSNIANILLILGASAVLTPILVTSNALKRDCAVMVAVTLVFAATAALMPLGALIGVLFVAALALYVFAAFRQERQLATGDHGAVYEKTMAAQAVDPALIPVESPTRPVFMSLFVAIAGLALVVLGGYFLVGGAVALARSLGVSETIIGLTIVAVGTSMPELVTSIMAAIRKQTDVAFGNIVGSNIYNILGIGGVTATIAPTRVPPEIVRFDNLVMIAASILLVAFAYTGRRISRWEGGLLVALYIGYVAWLWPYSTSGVNGTSRGSIHTCEHAIFSIG
ncbi:MAG: calcium/sodium antiporter [Alphaproteobacteria bacterium]